MSKLYYYSLLTISLLSFYGAVIYRFYKLNYAAIFLTVILVIITLILLKKSKKSNDKQENKRGLLKNSLTPLSITFFIFYFLFFILNITILFKSAITASIISPWQVIPWYFFITYTLSTIILSTHLSRITHNTLHITLISLHFLLSISIAIIIYTLGFGYDPFAHQATEKLIATTGSVDPKPFYYLSQYALVVILHKLTFIPIVWLDKLLIPTLAAIFLPSALFHTIKSLGARTKVALLATLFTLIFPFSTFIITTPQNFANLFLILIILFNITTYNLQFTTALALATLTIHPIAGIPAILFVALLYGKQRIKNKTLLTVHCSLFTILAIITLPLAFYINSRTSSIVSSDTVSQFVFLKIWQSPTPFLSGAENFILNFVYLYGFNIGIIIILFIIAGFIIHKKIPVHRSLFTVYLLMSASLFISYLITKTINFSYLIDYERSNFPDRILTIAVYFTLPFILLALYNLVNAVLKQNRIIKYSLLTFLTLLITASLYISYPRFDNYYNSRSYSTSIADVQAVQWINTDAGSEDYITLANQQVSAAALREFGFKKYYQTDESEIFYYPIPTGERLYQYYLDMVYKNANKKTAIEAADLVGADTTYFVLNKYWWAFDKIIAEAKMEAEEIKSFNNGDVFVFKYVK